MSEEPNLVQPEGVDAGSDRATAEGPGTPHGDVVSGGDVTKAPPEKGDGVSDQDPELVGSSEADGQDEGSLE